ncbi:lexA repressor [bacterium BMS3Abin04]|nr:lexA repressor [bacterium BMS3Abin04]
MRPKLTNRQLHILNFIQKFVEENHYPPTYRQIGKEFNIASTFGVKRHIDALVKKGYLKIASKSSRSIALVKNSNNISQESNASITIPIIGRVAAGYPVLAEENIEGTFTIDTSLIKSKNNIFALKTRGDSMIGAGILDGDLVLVNSQKYAKNGDIVVALIGDESTLKTYESKNGKTYLVPANKNYPVLDMTNKQDFSIIGKIIGVYRNYN